MTALLRLIAGIAFLIGIVAFLLAFGAHASDIQLILSGVFATCGAVALTGAAIIHRLDAWERRELERQRPTH